MKSLVRKLWVLMWVMMAPMCVCAQTINVELKGKPLPNALKIIEKQGGKSIIFSYNEAEKYTVNADIRQKTQAEAIAIVLQGTPLTFKERQEYFAIHKKDAQGKPIEIKGKVTDENNRPLAYSNVLLLTSDSTFVNGCVTKEDGSFLMLAESGTFYRLKVSFMGYKTALSPCELNNLIQLTPDAHTLKEVEVTAKRPLIEPKADGLKANVTGTYLAQMGSAAEMLSHLPFVTGSDGNYSVLGHGKPEIYINNRKVRDTSELDRLRADEILHAEVITTPGAEYASDVTAVIRIRTIKQRGQGWSGSFATNYSQGHWAKASQQISLNYRMGGLDIFAKGNLLENNTYGKTSTIIQLNGTNQWEITTNDVQTAKKRNLSAEVGFNYEVNEHHSFGMRYTPNGGLGDYDSQSWGESTAACNDITTNHSSFTTNTQTQSGWNHALNAYYTGTIGQWEIGFDADYLNNLTKENQQAEDGSKQDIHSCSDARSELYAAKLQINRAIGIGELSFGSEGTLTERLATFTQSGYSADAHDRIKQKSLAAFANYSIGFGKWEAGAGVRYEHRKTDYYNNGIHIAEQSPTYNDFIPTASISWADKDFSLSLSYRMMKGYPSYALLSNAVSYLSQYEYNTGNPLLEPTRINSLDIQASYKWLYATLQYQRIKNEIADITMPYNEVTHPGTLLLKSANLATYNSYSLTLLAAPQIGLWQPLFTAYVGLNPADGRNLGIEVYRKQPCFYFNWDNSFNFHKGWFLNIQADFQPASRQGFVNIHAGGQVNARLSKSFLKNNAMNLTLTANDIFRTGHDYFHAYGIHSFYGNKEYRDYQRIGIQLSYKFNATKSKYKGTGAGQDEKQRL